MPERVADEAVALEESEHVVLGRLEERKKLGHPRPSHEVDLARQRERLVALPRMHRDGETGRQRPRRRRPDHRKRAAAGELRLELRRHRRERKLHPHRGRPLLLVLDLRLRERRFAMHTPVDGLEPLVDEPPADEAAEIARDFTTTSLRTLLRTWPRWMLPFAYGGPSCRIQSGRSAATWRRRL